MAKVSAYVQNDLIKMWKKVDEESDKGLPTPSRLLQEAMMDELEHRGYDVRRCPTCGQLLQNQDHAWLGTRGKEPA